MKIKTSINIPSTLAVCDTFGRHRKVFVEETASAQSATLSDFGHNLQRLGDL